MLPFAIAFAATDVLVAGTLYWFYRNAQIFCDALDHTESTEADAQRGQVIQFNRSHHALHNKSDVEGNHAA